MRAIAVDERVVFHRRAHVVVTETTGEIPHLNTGQIGRGRRDVFDELCIYRILAQSIAPLRITDTSGAHQAIRRVDTARRRWDNYHRLDAQLAKVRERLA